MTLMAGMDLPVRAIREQISSALELVVHLERMRDGTRKVTHVAEIQGMEGDVITTQDLFTFKFEGENSDGKLYGSFNSSGLKPNFTERAQYFGLDRALLDCMSSGAGQGDVPS